MNIPVGVIEEDGFETVYASGTFGLNDEIEGDTSRPWSVAPLPPSFRMLADFTGLHARADSARVERLKQAQAHEERPRNMLEVIRQAQAQGKATDYPDGNPKTAAGMKKPDLSVVPPVSLLHLATAMMNGAEKYGPFNWRKLPISYRPYLAAAMRHLASCLDGEDFSVDTVEAGAPVHHLAHVMACCAIILDAIHQGTINDNRPAAGSTGGAIELYNRERRLLSGA